MDFEKDSNREAFEKEMLNSRYVAGNISAFWDKKTQDYDIAITELRMAWHAWQAAKAQAIPDGFVLVPRECPDPIFADKLFDHLCEKAHCEFGDDQMIFFSDIDESAIWQLMIEAQEPADD